MNLRELLLQPDAGDQLRAMHKAGKLKSFLPALAELDINDHRSHKHKNNLYHSIQVFEQARDRGDSKDIILLTAALIHDIGKKATRAFDAKGNPTFTQHETVGARMVRSVLKPHGYSNREIKLIEELVANHMRSFNFSEELWTDSAVRRFNADISSQEQLDRLMILFRADATSKFEKKRQAVYSKVDVLERRIREVAELDARAARRPAVNGNELMEIFQLKPGKQLGNYMRFLNSEEGLALSREEALLWVSKQLLAP